MMSREQYLLCKLAEEASEVAQIALKAQQFGMEESMQGQPYTNAERIGQEFTDLAAVLIMLEDEGYINYECIDEALEAKMEKVNKWCEYSRQLGQVRKD